MHGHALNLPKHSNQAFFKQLSQICLAICRWCDICIFKVRNKDVVVVVVVDLTVVKLLKLEDKLKFIFI